VSIEDSGFEPRANALGGWNRAGTSTNAEISRPVGQAPEGRQFLRFSPPTAPVASAELFDSPPMKGAHVTIDLGSGLRARVRLALSALQAAASAKLSAKLDTLRAAVEQVPDSSDLRDVDTRLAGVVVAWNVFRHFYPYWAETGVDWDARCCHSPNSRTPRTHATANATLSGS
jgi:hypothetical protein